VTNRTWAWNSTASHTSHVWSNQHLWFSKNCKCDLQMFSIKLTNLWFFLLINTLAMQQHLARLRHSYVADSIRQRLTQIEDWLCEFLSICCSGNHLIPSDMSFPYDRFYCKIVMCDTHTDRQTDTQFVFIYKIPQDEPFVCCMIFTYVYSMFLTFIKLVNNSMVSLGSFVLICVM
jgi:hypothetical protein